MQVPSEEWLERVQERCNDDEQFNQAAEWSDVNVVLEVGDERFWLKLYDGEIIDTMRYEPMSNPLGYDIVISGPTDAWQEVNDAEIPFWNAYSKGRITIDGNLLQANRMHEAIVRMAELMGENKIAEGEA